MQIRPQPERGGFRLNAVLRTDTYLAGGTVGKWWEGAHEAKARTAEWD